MIKESVSNSVTLFHANTERELSTVTESVLAGDFDVLIVSGGDGTLNQVVNCLLSFSAQPPLTLAVIPSGTGNSFAMDLGIHNVESAIAAIVEDKRQQVDVGVIKGEAQAQYFVNNFGVGLVYDISELASKMRRLGSFSYTLATLIKLIRLPSLTLSISGESGITQKDVLFYEVCNSKYTGGAMMMAPNVSLNDRKFQTITLKNISRRILLKTFPKLFKGTHIEETFVSTDMVTEVSIESTQKTHCLIDGDLSFSLQFTISMSPNQLSFIRK